MPPAREVSAGLFWGVIGPLLLAAVVFGLLLGTPWGPDSFDPSHGYGIVTVFLPPGLALCTPLVVGSRTRLHASLWAAAGSVVWTAVGMMPFAIGDGFSTELISPWLVVSAVVAAITVPLRATVLWGMPKDHAACIAPPRVPPGPPGVTRE